MVETDQLSVVCTSDGSPSITKSQTNEDQSAGVCIFLLCCCLPLYKFNRSYFVLVASKLSCVSCQCLVLGYVCSLSRKTRLRAWPTKVSNSRLLVYLIQSVVHTPPAPTVSNGVAKKKKNATVFTCSEVSKSLPSSYSGWTQVIMCLILGLWIITVCRVKM